MTDTNHTRFVRSSGRPQGAPICLTYELTISGLHDIRQNMLRCFVMIIMVLLDAVVSAQLCNAAPADWIERFLPASMAVSTPTPVLKIPPLPAPSTVQVDTKTYNRGVEIGNSGLKSLEAGNSTAAIAAFREAIALNPREASFQNNLAVAMEKNNGNPAEILELRRRLMALEPKDFTAPYGAGMVLLQKLKKPLESLPYFVRALELKPDDPDVAVALASAWNSAGYQDQAIELLNRYAHLAKKDAYPMYLLGMLLLERKDFVPAIRALESAAAMDTAGYAREALIRAKFYAGRLQGLAEEAEQLLRKYPGVPNRQSLERMVFSLFPHRLRLVETISVDLANPESVQNMRLVIRQLPSRKGHQEVTLEKAEWVSGNRTEPGEFLQADADGRSAIVTPAAFVGKRVSLRLQYLIKTEPWLATSGSCVPTASPDLQNLRRDEDLAVDSPDLTALEDRLHKLSGNSLQNYFLAIGRGLHYKENYENHSVPWIFSNLDLCDCTEFASLLAALCLHRNLPARIVTGFLLKMETIGQDTTIGHAWTEVYFPDRGWIPIDPTLGQNSYWAYFGNLLSDQIYFDFQEPGRKARVMVDLTAGNSDVGIKISSSYNFTLL
ncbi:MAG: tetratricopeptide repeat protein [Candidatus Riflebacteria bacterium]|nr:tetratricopeptide repeat protein [Candidatus Riflebacteria bacterium]